MGTRGRRPLVIGFGDGAAQLVGSRWGRRRLWAGRSLEGSAAFLLTAFAAALAFRLWRYGEAGLLASVLLAAALALAGALIEAFSTRLNDNFTVPVGVAALAWLLGH